MSTKQEDNRKTNREFVTHFGGQDVYYGDILLVHTHGHQHTAVAIGTLDGRLFVYHHGDNLIAFDAITPDQMILWLGKDLVDGYDLIATDDTELYLLNGIVK